MTVANPGTFFPTFPDLSVLFTRQPSLSSLSVIVGCPTSCKEASLTSAKMTAELRAPLLLPSTANDIKLCQEAGEQPVSSREGAPGAATGSAWASGPGLHYIDTYATSGLLIVLQGSYKQF